MEGDLDRIVQIPVVASSLSVEEVLEKAKRDLRCIEWDTLKNHKDKLIFGNVSDKSKTDASEFFSMSRPVQNGEAIDYFMSNSWHDDKDAKWEKLEQIAHSFRRTHGRYPTFWLDKVCIDQ